MDRMTEKGRQPGGGTERVLPSRGSSPSTCRRFRGRPPAAMMQVRCYGSCALLLIGVWTARSFDFRPGHSECKARSSCRGRLRIENVDQRPRAASQIVVKRTLVIDNKLACGKQESRALCLVRVIQVELADCQIK